MSVLQRRSPALQPGRLPSGIRGCMVAAPAALLLVLVGDLVLAVLRPATRSQVWLWQTLVVGAPIWFGAVLLVGLVVPTLLLGRRAPALLVEALVVAEFGIYYVSTRVSPMTGDAPALLQQAEGPDVWTSEALADAVHKLAFLLGGRLAVEYVGPVFGVLAVAAWLLLARRVSARWSIDVDLVRAFILATPLTFWFLVDYTENTFLATPFLVAGLAVLLGRPSLSARTVGGVLLGLAVAMHASNLAMVAAVAAAFLLGRRPLRERLLHVVAFIATAAVVEGAALTVCGLLGMRFNAYNMLGGYDHTMWVPMAPVGYLFRFVFFSHAHLIEVADIAVHAAPAFALALPVLVVRARRRVPALLAALRDDDGFLLIALTALAYLVFVAVWGFDFGPVGDLDLMLVLDVPLALYLLVLVGRLMPGRPRLVAALIGGSAAAELAFYSFKVSLVWWPPPSG